MTSEPHTHDRRRSASRPRRPRRSRAPRVGRQERAGGRSASHAADTHVPGWVAFVGAGPGDENLLTVRAAALIGRADLVVAPQWIGERLGHLLKPGATLADSDAQLADPKLLTKAAKAGQLAVRLFGGDPFMFCNAAADAAACAKARVPFEIVPGVSAATAVPEYAGIPLTTDVTGDVRIINASEVSRVSVERRHAGHPWRRDRTCRSGQDADRQWLGRERAVRDHLERHDDRAAHRRRHARLDRG